VAEDSYSNCHDHKDETSDELDKHSEPQKSPTVHQTMFSGHRGSGKEKDEQRIKQVCNVCVPHGVGAISAPITGGNVDGLNRSVQHHLI
jgi:hypothetical protein